MKKIFLSIITFFTPVFAHAHVRYIASDEAVLEHGGSDMQAFLAPLSNPQYLLLIGGVIIVVLLLYVLVHKWSWFVRWSDGVHQRIVSYKEHIPWIVRLSLGIALIGAGTAGVFMSPVIVGSAFLSFLQILVGFALLAGLLVGPASFVLIVLFLAALLQDAYLFGSLDILALILTLNIIDSRRPGIDDIVGIKDYATIPNLKKYLPTILRVGVGASLIFLALYEKVFNPNLSAYVVEVTNLTNVIAVTPEMWVFASGVIEFLIGFLLVIGYKTRLSAVIAIIVLSLSFFYFGEDVTSHITLFGTLSAVFILGGGPLSCDKKIGV